MAFNPNNFLSDNNAENKFNPDDFLAKSKGFDPDDYVEKKSSLKDTAKTAIDVIATPLAKLSDIATIKKTETSKIPQNVSLRGRTEVDNEYLKDAELKTKTEEINKEIAQDVFDKQFSKIAENIAPAIEKTSSLEELDKQQKKQAFLIRTLPAVAGVIGGAPLSIIAAFEGLQQGRNAIVQKTKGEEYNPIDSRSFAEILPEGTPEGARIGMTLLEMVADTALVAKGAGLAKKSLLIDSLRSSAKKLVKAGYDVDDVAKGVVKAKNAIEQNYDKINLDDAIRTNIETKTAKIPKAGSGKSSDIPKGNVVDADVVKPTKSIETSNLNKASKYMSDITYTPSKEVAINYLNKRLKPGIMEEFENVAKLSGFRNGKQLAEAMIQNEEQAMATSQDMLSPKPATPPPSQENIFEVSDEVLDNLAKKLKNGKDNDFYKFVNNHKNFIENRPKTTLAPEEYLKTKFQIENFKQPVTIKTPIEDVIMQEQHFNKMLSHGTDKSRRDFIPDFIATLERPNEILKAKDGKNYYIKLFYDEEFRPHLSIVAPKKDGSFFTTSFRMSLPDFLKRKNKGNRIYSIAQDATPQKRVANNIISDKTENSNLKSVIGNTVGIDKFSGGQRLPSVQEFKLSQKMLNLMKKHAPDSLIAESKNRPRNTLGVYYTGTGNIYLKALNDMGTAAHETVHAIDNDTDYIRNTMQEKQNSNYRKELRKIYLNEYPTASESAPALVKLKEGLAMLLQKAIENPAYVKANYNQAFETMLKNEKLKSFYEDARSIVNEYQGLDSVGKVQSRIVNEKLHTPEIVKKKPFLNFKDKMITEIFDSQYPIQKLAREGGVLETKNNPYLWTRLNSNINQIIANNINGSSGNYYTIGAGGDIEKRFDYNWKTLYNKLRGKTDLFDTLLVSRRIYEYQNKIDNIKQQIKNEKALYKTTKNAEIKKAAGAKILDLLNKQQALQQILKNDGISKDIATDSYNTLIKDKDFSEALNMYDSMVRSDLDLLHNKEVGLINDDLYSELIQNKGYAPFKRAEYNEITGDGEERLTKYISKGKVGSLKARKGSELSIVSPLNAALQNHNEIMRKAVQQVIYNKIGSIADKFPEIFQKVPLKTGKTTDGAIVFPQENNPNILMTRQQGKRIPYEVDKNIKKAIDETLTYESRHLIEDVLVKTGKLFTNLTTTLYPFFAPVNILRDQPAAFVQSQNGYIPLLTQSKILKAIAQNPQGDEARYLREYLDLAGTRHTLLGLKDNDPKEIEKLLLGDTKGIIDTAGKMGQTALDVLAIPSEYSEVATRAGEYILSRKNGKSSVEALEEAARVAAPFHHQGRFGGRVGRSVVKSIPYFNATLQVIAQAGRSLSKKSNASKFAFVTALMALGTAAANQYFQTHASEEEKQDHKNLTAQQLSMYMFFPDKKENSMTRIPMEQIYYTFGNLLNMIYNDKKYGYDYKAKDYIDAATSFMPSQFNIFEPEAALISLIPHLPKTVLSGLLGKKTFPQVMDIIPKSLQRKEPRMQFDENTSELAKWVGDKFNISPIMLDYYINNILGRTARFGLNFNDWNAFNPFKQKSYFSSGRLIQENYKTREKYKGLENSRDNLDRELTKEEQKWIKDNAKKVEGVDDLLSAYNDIMKNNKQNGIEDLTEKQKEIRRKVFALLK